MTVDGFCLCDVAQFNPPFVFAERRRVHLLYVTKPFVQRSSRDADIPALVNLNNRAEEFVQPFFLSAEIVTVGTPSACVRDVSNLSLSFAKLLFIGNIPFIDGDNQCSPFVQNLTGNCQILLVQNAVRIQNQNDNLCHICGIHRAFH